MGTLAPSASLPVAPRQLVRWPLVWFALLMWLVNWTPAMGIHSAVEWESPPLHMDQIQLAGLAFGIVALVMAAQMGRTLLGMLDRGERLPRKAWPRCDWRYLLLLLPLGLTWASVDAPNVALFSSGETTVGFAFDFATVWPLVWGGGAFLIVWQLRESLYASLAARGDE